MSEHPRVLLHNDETETLVDRLHAAQPQAIVQTCSSYEALPQVIATFAPEVLYTVRFAGSNYPRDAVLGPGGPRWIANGGVGTDHFGHWDTARVTITNAAGVAAGMMAEYILGAFLHFSLDVPGLQADKAGKVWRARTVTPLAGKTLLTVGLGHTGQALAQRAAAFGMTVIGTRARPQPMDGVDEVHPADALPILIPRADAIAICTPLTHATRGLIGQAEIAQIKPGTIFVDVSRGGVVDQAALHDALAQGQLKGAALDVFETEPLPSDNPLWSLPNVLISPHCSSVHDGWERASFDLFLTNLDRWVTGKPLQNVVDPDRGY